MVLKPWVRVSNAQSLKIAYCEARLTLKMSSNQEKLDATSRFKFLLKNDESVLNIILYNPFGLNFAKVHIDSETKTWTDKNASYDLQKHPLFKKWYNPSWWQEMAFLFGHISSSTSAYVWADQSGAPMAYENASRKISCERKGMHPSSCKLTDLDLVADMKFSSVRCKENL